MAQIQTPEEIVDELLNTHGTPEKAMQVLEYAIRKLRQAKTLLEPTPELTYMGYAHIILKSMNWGRV